MLQRGKQRRIPNLAAQQRGMTRSRVAVEGISMNIAKWTAILGSALLGLAATYAAPASAQATRTWVSGVGDDVNPCSRTAPCKTFAGAISKTAAGGEINCIDPGAYGAVTITKAIAIICDEVEAGVLASGTNGITVNAGANDAVFLSGLDVHGGGTGINGIRLLAGGVLHIQNVKIRAFNSTNGQGVLFAPSGASQLTIVDTTIDDNGSASSGGGILIQPNGTGSAKVVLQDVRLQNNASSAFKIDTTGNTGSGVTAVVQGSQITGSAAGFVVFTPASAASATALLNGSTVANSNFGVFGNGAAALIRVGDTTITGNGTGVFLAGGAIINSYADNRLDGNTTDGSFSATIAKK
jgi:hypothetical protein